MSKHYLFTRWQPLHYRMIGPVHLGIQKKNWMRQMNLDTMNLQNENTLHGEEKPGDPRNLDS